MSDRCLTDLPDLILPDGTRVWFKTKDDYFVWLQSQPCAPQAEVYMQLHENL